MQTYGEIKTPLFARSRGVIFCLFLTVVFVLTAGLCPNLLYKAYSTNITLATGKFRGCGNVKVCIQDYNKII